MIERLEKKEHLPGILERIRKALSSIDFTAPPSVPSATLREQYVFDEMQTTMQVRSTNYDRDYELPSHRQERTHPVRGYFTLVQKVIREFAEKGDAIIIGRGGQAVLSDMANAFHLLVIAPKDVRTRRIEERMQIEPRDAEKRVRQSDAERTRYLKHFVNLEWQDSSLYDMVINTNKISEDQAVNLICETVRSL